jgi:hypothetical protein
MANPEKLTSRGNAYQRNLASEKDSACQIAVIRGGQCRMPRWLTYQEHRTVGPTLLACEE